MVRSLDRSHFAVHPMLRVGELFYAGRGAPEFEFASVFAAGEFWWSVRLDSVFVGFPGSDNDDVRSGRREPSPLRPHPERDDDGLLLRKVVTDAVIPYLASPPNDATLRSNAGNVGLGGAGGACHESIRKC